GLSRLVEWPDGAGGRRSSFAVAVRVRRELVPGGRRTGRREGDLVLLGEWDDPRRAPREMWLGNLTTTPAGAALRLARLAAQVAQDSELLGERVGLRDFEGRSYPGWHRHMTLASTALAVSAAWERGGFASDCGHEHSHSRGHEHTHEHTRGHRTRGLTVARAACRGYGTTGVRKLPA
ncbi:hypothetical protein K6I34_006656, partial [Streptomyces sp. UNOC14_S4]|nr:hypothetical protein [Streptomyces sp. UNOC14_S4]